MDFFVCTGALTHGDRRATETRDLSQFNIDNKYGRAALEATMKTIMGYEVSENISFLYISCRLFISSITKDLKLKLKRSKNA